MNNIIIIENKMIILKMKHRTQHIAIPIHANNVNIINSSVDIVEGIASANFYALFLYFVILT